MAVSQYEKLLASDAETVQYSIARTSDIPTKAQYLASKAGTAVIVNSGIYKIETPTYQRVGGRIFYINPDATGAIYKFYDSNYNNITDISISGLADAYYYTKTGTGSTDKFYVYDSTNGRVYSKEWGAYGTLVGTSDGIGLGKTNTATALANPACFTPFTSGNTTIWTYLRDSINASSVGGCSDWFIGSTVEQDQLKASGLVEWYDDHGNMWSSVESDTYNTAYAWYADTSRWKGTFLKYNICWVCPFRAF